MLILRVAGLAIAVALGVLVLAYTLTGERKYLSIAWRVFKVALAAALVVLLILFFERLVVMV
jgi:hypothetical protein